MRVDFDSAEFRRVLGHFPTGVVVVAARCADGRPVGMSVGTFTSVSLDPPLVAFLPAKTSTSWPQISEAGSFCVNVLGHPQEEIGRRFSRSGGDKFAGVEWSPAPSGSPILPSVLAWIDCELENVVDAGDHWIVLGKVNALSADPDGEGPLVFYRGRFGHFGQPVAEELPKPG